MKNKDYIQELLVHFENNENEPILISEEKILNEFQKNNENHSLAIKILSVFGGIMASIAFSVFIGITGIYEMDFVSFVLGFTLIGFGLVANKNIENILIDTLSISVFIIVYILIGIGFSSLGSSENTITTVILLTAFSSIIFVQNFMIAFISILVINGCFITLMITNDFADLIQIYVSILAFSLAELFLNEAKFIKMNTAMSLLFNPLKIGVLLSFLFTLILLAVKWFLELSTDYLWISSIPIIFIILYFLKHLTKTLKINDKTTKLKIYIFVLNAINWTRYLI